MILQNNSALVKSQTRRRISAIVVVLFSIIFSAALIGWSEYLSLQFTDDGEPKYRWVAGVLQALAIGILTSVILGVFAELALRKQMLDDFSHETEGQLKKFFDLTVSSSQKYGFSGILDELPIRKFFEDTSAGDEVLWLDTYAPGHHDWLDLLESKAAEGVKFRFLVLEPECDLSKLRQVEIGGRFEDHFVEELRIFRNDILRISKTPSTSGNIKVMTYSDLLANPFYMIKRENRPIKAITSYYLRRATGVQFPHLEWNESEKGFVHVLNEYFEWKWTNALKTSDDQISK